MGIRESLLNTITTVANGDFVRVVTSAGASSKATVANLFKSFESGLSAKSSLTTSDYIRVVGSDNVSYKQSLTSVNNALPVKAEVDALKSNMAGLSVSKITISQANTPQVFAVPNSYRGLVLFFDSSTARNAAYFLYATATGVATIVPIVTATGISITTGTREITVTATGMPTVIFINVAQKIS